MHALGLSAWAAAAALRLRGRHARTQDFQKNEATQDDDEKCDARVAIQHSIIEWWSTCGRPDVDPKIGARALKFMNDEAKIEHTRVRGWLLLVVVVAENFRQLPPKKIFDFTLNSIFFFEETFGGHEIMQLA